MRASGAWFIARKNKVAGRVPEFINFGASVHR